jgi:hypothetical protein
LSEVLGIIFGETLIKMMPDWLGLQVSVCFILISNIALQMPDITPIMTYFLFMIQIFFIGIAYNLEFIILERRTQPKHLALSIEITVCVG